MGEVSAEMPSMANEAFGNALLRARYNGIIRVVDESLAARDYRDFLERVSLTLRSLFDANFVTIHLLSPDKSEFVEQTGAGVEHFGASSFDWTRIPNDVGRISLLIAGRQLVPMSFRNPDLSDVWNEGSPGGLVCSVSVPLFVDSNAFGFFTLVYDHEVSWPRRDLDYLLTIGHLLGAIFRRLHMSSNAFVHSGDLRECRLLSQEIRRELEMVLALTKAEKPVSIPGFSAAGSSEKRRSLGDGASRRDNLVHAEAAESSFITPGDSYRPTPREMQLMAYAAEGLTNKEIAEVLSISVGGVKKMFSRIMQKSGLRNRSQIVAYAMRKGYTV